MKVRRRYKIAEGLGRFASMAWLAVARSSQAANLTHGFDDSDCSVLVLLMLMLSVASLPAPPTLSTALSPCASSPHQPPSQPPPAEPWPRPLPSGHLASPNGQA